MESQSYSLQDAYDYFCTQSNLSPLTLETYRYALQHFYSFLEESNMAEPLSLSGPNAAEQSLEALGTTSQDVNLLTWFINYLGHEVRSANPKRGKQTTKSLRLEPGTVRVYGQAIITWFSFLADELLIPEPFPTSAAIARAKRILRTYVPVALTREGAIEPPEGMEKLIHAYDSPSIPESLPFKERHRRKLENLRNRAILYALADSGARISEILRLTADHIRAARLNNQGVCQIRVRGKGRGRYGREVTLRFTHPTLKAMREYLQARNEPSATALYVSHAKTRPKYRGLPLSTNAAWRMVQRTAKSMGLSHIHPHDFRHWRATQMLREGVPIDQVQRFLNHRSIRTTQLYAKTADKHVDESGVRTSPIINT